MPEPRGHRDCQSVVSGIPSPRGKEPPYPDLCLIRIYALDLLVHPDPEHHNIHPIPLNNEQGKYLPLLCNSGTLKVIPFIPYPVPYAQT